MLESILSPADVRKLDATQLPALAREVRETILNTVSRTGGHLASSLGSVELSIALLRVFFPPEDKVVWDVGHQAYAWKLLTGRAGQFSSLRQLDGISGFPKPAESPYDAAIAGHAGAALSTAIGLATGLKLAGTERQVIAVVGDAAMTNGISFEALNNLEETPGKVIVVLNDNEMSIAQNVGALSRHLGRMLVDVRYNRIKNAAEAAGHKLHMTFLRRFYHRLESMIKSVWLQNAFFEEFGLRYIGPIDGHDFHALENALYSAREYKHSVLIHVATQKGRGYPPAEKAPRLWHGVGPFQKETGETGKPKYDFSAAFGKALCHFAERDPKIVAITAAMRDGTGLTEFATRFPDRFFDAGICEEHVAVFAAGLAASGMKPVFAVYSTFLQRAVDCVMHDTCLSNLPVVFCIDRAGVVGNDGPTHHGLFDIPMLRCLPNLTIMQPKNDAELASMLQCAFRHHAPCAIRYPRGVIPRYEPPDHEPFPPVLFGRAEVVSPADVAINASAPVWIWALGDCIADAEELANGLRDVGINAGVVNARFIKPIDKDLLRAQAKRARLIVTIENGALSGGFGSAIREILSDCPCPVHAFGWPDQFIPQGSTQQLRERYELTAPQMLKELFRSVLTPHKPQRPAEGV